MSEPTKQPTTPETSTEAVADAQPIYVPDYGVTVQAKDGDEAVKIAKKQASKKEDK